MSKEIKALEEKVKQLKLERDTAVFVARERLDNIERIQNQKEIFELRYLKADKEIERLNEELKYTIPIVEHNKTITKHLKEIERLKKIIGHALGYIECANKVDITYVCKILTGSGKE